MNRQIKKIVLSVCLCALFYTINAQSQKTHEVNGRLILLTTLDGDKAIEGSTYINKEFRPIKIDKYEGIIYSGRYNALNGEMQVKLDETNIIALNMSEDFEVKFTLDNKRYRIETIITDKEITKRSFLVVVSENNKLTLYKQERIKFYKKVVASSSYDNDKPAKYKRQDDYYYLKLNDTITTIPKRKKDFLKAFPKQADKLKSYIKKNKFNIKDENDLIKVVDYLSTIIK